MLFFFLPWGTYLIIVEIQRTLSLTSRKLQVNWCLWVGMKWQVGCPTGSSHPLNWFYQQRNGSMVPMPTSTLSLFYLMVIISTMHLCQWLKLCHVAEFFSPFLACSKCSLFHESGLWNLPFMSIYCCLLNTSEEPTQVSTTYIVNRAKI